MAVLTCRAGAGANYSGSDKRFASAGVEVGDAGAAIATDRHRRLANRCCRLRPVGSASAVPGPFLAGAMSLGRSSRRLVMLDLLVLLGQ